LVYFALAFPLPFSSGLYAQLLFQSGCFDFASPQKVPNGSSTDQGCDNLRPNRQINFLFLQLHRFCIAKEPSNSGPFIFSETQFRLFSERCLRCGKPCNRHAEW